MPPKQAAGSGAKQQASRKGNAGGAQAEELQQEPLQAVILADAFSKRLAPLTMDRPSCLLPLCNVALIDWTLENLALAGVEDVFILASQHVDQIKRHVAQSRPALPKLTVIATPDAQSIGDVMRELDAKQIIRSDFILVHGDSVASMDLASVVAAHKQRRKREKDAIMTICTMPVGKHSRTRPPGDLALFFLEPTTSQLLHYAPLRAVPRVKSTTLPLELFDSDAAPTLSGASNGAEVDVRNDLVDCGIDICSVDVPPLFSENFDYQTMRRDFVLGILTSDLLDSKIYVHVAPTGPPGSRCAASSSANHTVVGTSTYGRGYAARVKSPAAYDAISRDVIAKWTHPLAPSGCLPGGERYSPRAGLRYVGKDVVLSRTCTFGPASLLGSHSQIGDKACVEQSIIGPSVQIGARSTIVGSYIWAGAQIGEGCVVERAIVGEGARILDGVKLGRGTIVASGCVIGPNVELEPYARVAMKRFGAELEDDDDFDDDTVDEDVDEGGEADRNKAHESETSSKELGSQGVGYLWPALGERRRDPEVAGSDDESSDDEIDEIEAGLNARVMRLAAELDEVEFSDSLSDVSSIDVAGFSSSDEDDDGDDGSRSSASDTDSDDGEDLVGSGLLTLSAGTTTAEKAAAAERLAEFKTEAQASLERAFEEGHTVDNAAIELKTLRMASNVPLTEVRITVIPFVLSKCDADKPKETVETLDRWGGLIQSVAADDEVDALIVVQRFCATSPMYFKLFIPLLKKFYNDDIVSDESIVAWWRSPLSRKSTPEVGGDKALALRKAAEDVVRYVLESQEDSDDDEDDESDDE
ncbi:translation initiation factor eIF-2B epsilon subunit, GEF [Thecaphora frezii]